MQMEVGVGVLCLKESDSAKNLPTPVQSLQIEKSARKKKKEEEKLGSKA